MKMDMKSLKKMFSAKNLGKNSENILIGVLVLVLLVLVVVYVMKNREGFDAKKAVVVYFFHVDWCGYCQKAKPEVAKLEEDLKSNNNMVGNVKVEFKSVNAEEDAKLAEQHNVRAYPTCVLEKANGETVELDKACTFENLREFIETNA